MASPGAPTGLAAPRGVGGTQPRGLGPFAPINLVEHLAQHVSCYSLLRLAAGSPKQRPLVGSGDVRKLRYFGP